LALLDNSRTATYKTYQDCPWTTIVVAILN
jgi:hypothetical protein